MKITANELSGWLAFVVILGISLAGGDDDGRPTSLVYSFGEAFLIGLVLLGIYFAWEKLRRRPE